MNKVKFMGELCTVEFAKYQSNDRTAIRLVCEDGSPMATASVNLVDEHLEDDEVAIKTWGGQETILEALIEAKVVSEPVRSAQTGFVTAPICKIFWAENKEYVEFLESLKK